MKKILAYFLMIATCYGVDYQVNLSDLNDAEWVEVAPGDYRILWSDIGGVTPSGWSDPYTNNLVGVWYMETTNGAVTYVDSWTNDFDGTPEPSVATGPTGGIDLGNRPDATQETATEFDGTDDGINLGNSSLLSFDGGVPDLPFTMMAWIFMDDDFGFRILSRSENTGTRPIEYLFGTTGSGDVVLVCYGEGSYSQSIRAISDNPSITGQWIHVTATYDASKSETGIYLYTNAVEASATKSETGTYTGMSNDGRNTRIGKEADSPQYSDGLIDDVRIYNRVLTSAEIGVIYTNTLHPTNSIETRLNQ